jgi:phage terminase large subunit-like protein
MTTALLNRRALALERERALRARDPLLAAFRSATAAQRGWIESTAREKGAEGGNQSGKTRSVIVDFLLQALGIHPSRRWVPPVPGATWKGWYSTTTYQLFAEQGWHHMRSLLLFAGEQVPKSGAQTRRIVEIGWDKKSPERVKYLKLKREDGHLAEIYIKSYDQGRQEFQSAEVDYLALDEECPEEIYEEAQPRILRRGGQIGVGATPVEGVQWLEELRARAEKGDPDVFHTRFSTIDNPSLSPADLSKLVKRFEGRPDLARLRLEGYPVVDEGKVYPDVIFNVPGRIVKPFTIGGEWAKYRGIDHGVHVCAGLWVAVAPGRKKIALYREYYGEDVEPVVGRGLDEHGVPLDRGNAANIRILSQEDGGEHIYQESIIDKATLGSGQETGTPLIELWEEAGVRCEACPDNRLEPGIERVKNLMAERAPDGTPLLVIFDTCTHYLRERRLYSRQPRREKGDDGPMRPVKRVDHTQDVLRYLVALGLEPAAPKPPPVPPQGTIGRKFWEQRNRKVRKSTL